MEAPGEFIERYSTVPSAFRTTFQMLDRVSQGRNRSRKWLGLK